MFAVNCVIGNATFDMLKHNLPRHAPRAAGTLTALVVSAQCPHARHLMRHRGAHGEQADDEVDMVVVVQLLPAFNDSRPSRHVMPRPPLSFISQSG